MEKFNFVVTSTTVSNISNKYSESLWQRIKNIFSGKVNTVVSHFTVKAYSVNKEPYNYGKYTSDLFKDVHFDCVDIHKQLRVSGYSFDTVYYTTFIVRFIGTELETSIMYDRLSNCKQLIKLQWKN